MLTFKTGWLKPKLDFILSTFNMDMRLPIIIDRPYNERIDIVQRLIAWVLKEFALSNLKQNSILTHPTRSQIPEFRMKLP